MEFLVPFEGKNTFNENNKELEPHSRLMVNAIAQAEALITGTQTNKDQYRNMTVIDSPLLLAGITNG